MALPELGAELQLPEPGLRRRKIRPVRLSRVLVVHRFGCGGNARLFVEHARDVQRRREREEELPEALEETEAERMVREVDAQVAEASKAFDADRLEEELLRRA
ncbi:hypothetical protein GBAR_LOCUS17249 [Geodia barretti]|uniref:Uncharacterized protein n=1 Tax=Geodia barretti TaxID=519541 RepID=A0AA35WXQ2_GEOBA|nr:hypothetical protein GBAR_LOCUS17249 [Geodia barretti]